MVDIVVPAGGGPREVLLRLRTLKAASSEATGVVVVDAGLDPDRRAAVEALVAGWPGARLITAPTQGSSAAALRAGLLASTADLVLVLDERTHVPPGGLARLVALAERDPGVALIQGLVTGDGPTGVPLPPGATWRSLDAAIAEAGAGRRADLPVAQATGLLIRRAALRALKDGGADPTSDLAASLPDLPARLRAGGWQVVLALDVVLHRERSVEGEARRSGTARRMAATLAAPPIATPGQVEALRRAVAVRSHVHLGPLARFAVRHPKKALRLALGKVGLGRESAGPGETPEVLDPRREDLERLRRADALTVNVLLPAVAVNGGTIHVLDLAQRLALGGVDVRVLAPLPVDRRLLAGAAFEPAIYTSADALLRGAPSADATLATWWRTAPWLAELARSGRAGAPVYYVQDYEPWFYPEGDPRRQHVEATYGLGAGLVCTSPWLGSKLAEHGHRAELLPIGFQPDRFRPRPPGPRPGGGLRLIALCNPQAPRRGADTLFQALEAIHRARPDITFVLFGAVDLAERQLPFPVEDVGRISRRDALPALYAGCDLFLDPSEHQAFGLPAMEAMASGLACVLPSQGGVPVYAKDGENALLVPPRDPAALAAAALRLVEDPGLRQRLAAAARRTALGSTIDHETTRWRALLEEITSGARHPRASA